MSRLSLILMATLFGSTAGLAQIPSPTDAPQPLSPEESVKHFRVPQGFRLELIAAEPVIREPSGVCWDEQGRLFVTELHGYNLEGQFDVDTLNKSGQLDKIPRRVPASDEAKKAAEAGTFGTVKLLLDRDHDGRYEAAEIWADDLPPCYGACPARGGIIVCCAPDIVFLADRDNDGRPEVRETLFTGLPSGLLERGVNNPQWGPEHWIYFGRGNKAATVTGPHLKAPVQLPQTDFRIRADGTAIEPIVGGTHTIGFAFTGLGDRFVTTTRTPALWVVPLSWQSLQRNPFVPNGSLELDAAGYQMAFPASRPHPWRVHRSTDPGFNTLYTDRYGIEESVPNGYFTSACSPLVYQDAAMAPLQGMILTCEPAQNMVHRAQIVREGSRLVVKRLPVEERSEFLTSTDSWFHPIAMSHAPDGAIILTDFYREIIEDYSAVPRFLQQIYGVVNGQDRGRLWRLSHVDAPAAPPADMSRLTNMQLAREVLSPYYWRRETARRLLTETLSEDVAPEIARLLPKAPNPQAYYNALETLGQLDAVSLEVLAAGITHAQPEIRRLSIQLAERRPGNEELLRELLTHSDDEPLVRLQFASSLGAFPSTEAARGLVDLARKYGDELYLATAILSASTDRSGVMLKELLEAPQELGQARSVVQSLATTVGGRADAGELSEVVAAIGRCSDRRLQASCLAGVASGVSGSDRTSTLKDSLSGEMRSALRAMASGPSREMRDSARRLIFALNLESAAERTQRLGEAMRRLGDPGAPAAQQMDAVEELASDNARESTQALVQAFASSTPQVSNAILQALVSRPERSSELLDAIQSNEIPGSVLSALQRATLLESNDAAIRERAKNTFSSINSVDPEMFQSYLRALQMPRDMEHGLEVFRDRCGNCHRAHEIGTAVGPDLTAEFQRAEEALVSDLLAPSESIAAGYASYIVLTQSGQTLSGLISAESPTSVTLRQSEGKETVVLRSEIEELHASAVSLMPDDLVKTVSTKDFADAIAWLRRPLAQCVLLDENRGIVAEFNSGDGTMEMILGDAFSGQMSLQVTPLQRSNARISHWEFRIREHPALGEYRHLRFAWKSIDASGVMLELAADGSWPPPAQAIRRYYAGGNSSPWAAVEVSPDVPEAWTVVTRDLWAESGDFTLTGIAPTALGGAVQFDRIELLQ